jgi:membrane protein
VKVTSALTGAFVGAMLWEAGKWGFAQYLRFSTGSAKLYGSIALVPLFLLWVYITWCIVLAGLNIAYFLQHGRRKTVARPVEQINPGVVEPGSAVALAAALAHRFDKGEPADAGALAGMVGLDEGIVTQMLERLVTAGVALRAKHRNEDGYFALARPAERITAEEVLRVGEELISQTDGPAAQAMRLARHHVVKGRTLAAFVDSGGKTAPASSPRQEAESPAPLGGPARA